MAHVDLTRKIDIYCERTDFAFWSEPINALTNLAFIAAAIFAWRLAKQRGAADGAILLLVILAAAVGVGSFLFHTFAERWAGIADTTPIMAFVLAYALIAIRRFFGASWLRTILIVAAGVLVLRLALPPILAMLPRWNGSLGYAPALVAMAALALALRATGRSAWKPVLAAAGVLVASLFFRTIDGQVCADFPLGTHFLWHILNGAVFAIVLAALIVHGRPVGRTTS